MFISKIIILYLTAIYPSYGQKSDAKGANASSTEVTIGCLSGDSSVMLTNGERKQIGYLQSGDEVLTVDHLNIVPTEMVIMLDKQTSKQAQFYTFATDSGHKISLTGLHLIPIISSNNKMNYIAAREVQLGDQLYALVNGTLLVNDVFVSCYASVKNHQWAQIFMTPFHWYYRLARFISVNDPFDNNRADGIHWAVHIIYQLKIYIQHLILEIL
ncbi:unnamed protein product [Rotaria sp. Silwood1]|nr:unnamed protein product [Rotaria sp. Silwood1]CAF3847581.1 unnamed protein product [Rotaria sp. Silwood1]CAF4818835.1 unnamed protein product [Rotaria sp. Silwood1]CAF4882825.1 unnamed protein product [Rotaria sp. Silwood1]